MLKNRNNRHRVPALNTTSTADISFMLLTFFLVTTSMDTDKGLVSQLPPPSQANEAKEAEVEQRNVMNVAIDANDKLTCDGKPITHEGLKAKVMAFVENKSNSPLLPEKYYRNIPLLGKQMVTGKHVIFIQADSNTSYNAYFAMQNAIISAYNELRDKLAKAKFSHSYKECTQEERDAVAKCYPQRISEADQMTGKGGNQ